ncbi:LPD1 domain-containing protein [Gracilibacillus sp. YIM 98692]|uniref:LPD1 domain-containing protein n=1 Tax=Gracilibacillus sp. YIM 98692 TaxID=2663532 RepID=UPI0013D8455B|nr:LPD1 domain-containing protein [Gracilibacillus sp. YIM 98692]
MKQVTLFDFEKKSEDIRTDKQRNRRIAYDVGEKIRGSRKEEASLRKAFGEMQNNERLQQLEDISPQVAAEMVTRDLIFDNFSLKEEKEKGTEPVVARVKQLVIQRIGKVPQEDSPEGRAAYLRAALFYKETMESVLTFDDLKDKVYELRKTMNYEGSNLQYAYERIQQADAYLRQLDAKENDKLYERSKRDKKQYTEYIAKVHKANELPLRCLGKKFSNFFLQAKSANNTINNVMDKVQSWDDLLTTKKRTQRKKTSRVWERELPERPNRIGGPISKVRTPEQLQDAFSLRGVQFGHWTNDDIGANHLFRFSEAFYDLADILQINTYTSLSFNQRLGIAFGSRGRGTALASYEPLEKVINFTRNKGSLGNTAHEWFHGLDHWLFDFSHNYQNGQLGYITNQQGCGTNLSVKVRHAVEQLMDMIIKGEGIEMITNKNEDHTTWRLSSRIKSLYRRENGSVRNALLSYRLQQEEQLDRRIDMIDKMYSAVSKQQIEKMKKKQIRELNKIAQALAWLHECETGERLQEIPIPTDKSNFYLQAIKLDKGKKGYWSRPIELAARAFEAYIEDKLKEQGRRNDYLVCGTYDKKVFPVGEERVKINNAFDQFIRVIRDTFAL